MATTFCTNCGSPGEGTFCADCGMARDPALAAHKAAESERSAQVAKLQSNIDRDMRHGVPALLSFFLPGVGQLIKGRFLLAIMIWLGGIGLAVVAVVVAPMGVIGWIVLWCWQIYDAYVGPDSVVAQRIADERLARHLRK